MSHKGQKLTFHHVRQRTIHLWQYSKLRLSIDHHDNAMCLGAEPCCNFMATLDHERCDASPMRSAGPEVLGLAAQWSFWGMLEMEALLLDLLWHRAALRSRLPFRRSPGLSGVVSVGCLALDRGPAGPPMTLGNMRLLGVQRITSDLNTHVSKRPRSKASKTRTMQSTSPLPRHPASWLAI
jgi:hypothetical protein